MRGTADEQDIDLGTPLAIFCSDIHLQENPPPARSTESNWYQAMIRPMIELDELSSKLNVPVIIAGDIFDRWNSPPSLINLALHLITFHCSAIPGQHDLPNHNYEDIEKSAYWTLVKANKIHNLYIDRFTRVGSILVYGFPWGFPLKVNKHRTTFDTGKINVAVVHKYTWLGADKFLGASKNDHAYNLQRDLKEFDLIVTGDNHQGFICKQKGYPTVFNCGTFMRRTITEKGYMPMVGILYSSGEIVPHYLDIKSDKFFDPGKAKQNTHHAQDFALLIAEFANLAIQSQDFLEKLEELMPQFSESMQTALRSVIERVRNARTK